MIRFQTRAVSASVNELELAGELVASPHRAKDGGSQVPRNRRIQRPRAFRVSRPVTITLALAIAILGVFLFYLGSPEKEDNHLLISIGSALFTLGLVSLISDLFLRSVYTYDLLELVQLQEHVHQVGFLETALESRVTWDEIYADRRRFRFLLANPQGWAVREWQSVLEVARSTAIVVDVYLPNVELQPALDVGASMGFDQKDYHQLITQTARSLEASWKLGKARREISDDAHLSIYRVDDPVLFTLIQLDDNFALILHQSGLPTQPADGLAMRYAIGDNALPGWWFKQQWRNLDERRYELYYSDRSVAPLRAEAEGET